MKGYDSLQILTTVKLNMVNNVHNNCGIYIKIM